jgi:hypothetical protein
MWSPNLEIQKELKDDMIFRLLEKIDTWRMKRLFQGEKIHILKKQLKQNKLWMLEKAGLFNQNLEVTVKNHKLQTTKKMS